ncbi:MAG: hypothetical protein U1C57_00345 [Candidatus Doudnabacteria bacterium]|nr:hypothetical protein [bacterium]MDZ4243540.1 hypothetical protein [Candidatus Doudnabacteria bacterium]
MTKSKIKICPICFGTSGSWILLSFGVLTGFLEFAEFQPIIALLMGGTVVGISYQTRGTVRPLTLLIGFGLAYWFLSHLSWTVFGIELVLLTVAGYVFFVAPRAKSPHYEKTKQLEEKLKNCC